MRLDILKEKTGAEFVFEITEEKKESHGEFSGNLDRVYLVLKQTIDALGENPFRELMIEFRDGTLLILDKKDGFVGLFLKGNIDVNAIRRVMIEAEEEVEKPEEVVEVEEVKEEEKVVEVLGDEIVGELKEIAGGYLGDFAEEIFINVWEDEGMDGKDKTKENIIEFIYSLQRSASMIIGPSKAQSMAEEMIERIKQK